MRKKNLFCIMGESRAGKDTIIRELEKKKICVPVVSYATRPMREGEVEGREHFFITDEQSKELQKTESVIAYTKIESPSNPGTGYEYFATIEKNENANTYIIDPNGIKSLERSCKGDIRLVKIYIYAPLWIRRLRGSNRKESPDIFKLRCENEKEQFEELRNKHLYDYKIRNYGPFGLYAKLKLRMIIWKENRHNAKQ